MPLPFLFLASSLESIESLFCKLYEVNLTQALPCFHWAEGNICAVVCFMHSQNRQDGQARKGPKITEEKTLAVSLGKLRPRE